MNRLTVALLGILALDVSAQTRQTEVKRGRVVYVSGNDLLVRTEDNAVKHFKVPDDFKFNVDGKDIGIQDLQPGTVLTQTITTTSEEKMVTNTRNVDAKVIEAKPPYLTVALPDDKIKRVRVPDGTKFTVGGKQMVLSELRQGMRLKGTVATTTPTTVVSKTRNVTGKSLDLSELDSAVLIGVLVIEEVDVP
jgi:hypothetical protein